MAANDQYFHDILLEDLSGRCELLLELLDSLSDLPAEIKDIKEMLVRLEHDHDLLYPTMKQHS